MMMSIKHSVNFQNELIKTVPAGRSQISAIYELSFGIFSAMLKYQNFYSLLLTG